VLAIYSVTRVVHRGRRDCQVGLDDRGNERGELLSSPVCLVCTERKEVNGPVTVFPIPDDFKCILHRSD